MTVHVLIPVHNRVSLTRAVLECVREQTCDDTLTITVIDDGSADGTYEFLATQPDLNVIRGNGNLWWGGAIQLGVQKVLEQCSASDWILFLNNDVRIERNFVQTLLMTARMHAPACVGSVIRDIRAPHDLLSVGPRVDAWRILVWDDVDANTAANEQNELRDMDMLSGRGVLFPVSAFRLAGTLRPFWLPHYLADYELSVRMRRRGYKLLVNTKAAVFSSPEFGNTSRVAPKPTKWLSPRSPYYLPAHLAFWWQVGTWMQRMTLPVRISLFLAFPQIRRKRLSLLREP